MPAHAGSFSISPVRLDLSSAARSASLTVRNEEREALVQAQVMLWEQVDGEEKLTSTRDLLVSPAVFTLAQDGSQLVRVALRSAPTDPTRELSYRLILQEVPQPANPNFSGLQIALRLSVPVFVAKPGSTGPALAWSAAPSDNGLVITAQNSGDVGPGLSVQIGDVRAIADQAASPRESSACRHRGQSVLRRQGDDLMFPLIVE